MADKKRDYKKEYENYQGKPDQIKKRASRNAARRKMEADGNALKEMERTLTIKTAIQKIILNQT